MLFTNAAVCYNRVPFSGIRRYLSVPEVFEPEAIAAMSKAFEEACVALHVRSGDIHGRLTVATRIVDLASTGVIDADALRDRVIGESQTVAMVYSTVPNDMHA